jgi:hypothetical protein
MGHPLGSRRGIQSNGSPPLLFSGKELTKIPSPFLSSQIVFRFRLWLVKLWKILVLLSLDFIHRARILSLHSSSSHFNHSLHFFSKLLNSSRTFGLRVSPSSLEPSLESSFSISMFSFLFLAFHLGIQFFIAALVFFRFFTSCIIRGSLLSTCSFFQVEVTMFWKSGSSNHTLLIFKGEGGVTKLGLHLKEIGRWYELPPSSTFDKNLRPFSKKNYETKIYRVVSQLHLFCSKISPCRGEPHWFHIH